MALFLFLFRLLEYVLFSIFISNKKKLFKLSTLMCNDSRILKHLIFL